MMYKYVGFGLLSLFALIAIPVTTNAESNDPSMYGMTFLSLKDSTGNVLFENIIHNEVLNQGTRYMFDMTFKQAFPVNTEFTTETINAICVTNKTGFTATDTDAGSTFNAGDGLTLGRCIANFDYTTTANSADSGILTFNTTDHINPGSTITGLGVCQAPFNASPNTALDCNTSEFTVMFAEIDTPDTLVEEDDTLEVRYVLNLD